LLYNDFFKDRLRRALKTGRGGLGDKSAEASGRGNLRNIFLADAGPQNAAVVLQTYLATGKQVCDGCDRLSIATGARTDCQNQVA
jgi:hypothetical protein